MINGKSVNWSHIVSTVEHDMACGLSLLPRVKHEHIRLSPQLRMRVKLAAQVLSSSMANAITLRGKPEMTETAKFCRMMDRWFDCLNGRYFDEGTRKRKPDLGPYFSIDDERFIWLEVEFLGWLEGWERDVDTQSNLSVAEKKKMCLSYQTSSGLRITTLSFIQLVKDILSEQGSKFFLPEKINQDRLEVLFSKLRRSVGDSDNPTIDDVRYRIIGLLVAGRHAVTPKNSNSISVDDGDCNYLPKKEV